MGSGKLVPDIIAATTDGVVYNDQNDLTPGGATTQVNDGWTPCRNSPTGSKAQNSIQYTTAGTQVKKWLDTDAGRFTIRRSFFAFDTSGIDDDPAADDCATAATLKIYGSTYGTADIIIVKATAPDLSTGVATGDFNALHGWDSSFGPSDLTIYSSEVSTWSTSGYNSITLNAAALSDMNDLDVFKLAIIEYDHDYLDVEYDPGTSGEVNAGMYYSQGPSGKKPVISYTAGGCGYSHSIDGVSAANIGGVIGVSTANIANRSGVPT